MRAVPLLRERLLLRPVIGLDTAAPSVGACRARRRPRSVGRRRRPAPRRRPLWPRAARCPPPTRSRDQGTRWVGTALRPAGSSSRTEVSRSPKTVMAMVRGIGVAVMTRRWGVWVARWPGRSDPRARAGRRAGRRRSGAARRRRRGRGRGSAPCSDSSAWVPTTIAGSPAARRRGSAALGGRGWSRSAAWTRVARSAPPSIPTRPRGPRTASSDGVVLGGEDLGGGQEGGLPAASDDLEHGAQGDEGLAAAHVALQEALHGHGAGQVGARSPHRRAPARPSGRRAGGRRGPLAGSPPPPGRARRPRCASPDDGLGAGPGRSGGRVPPRGAAVSAPAATARVLGRVNPAVGGEASTSPWPRARAPRGGDRGRPPARAGPGRVRTALATRQDGQRLGGRVDGQGAGQQGLALGLIELVENLEARAGQLLAAAVEADLAD